MDGFSYLNMIKNIKLLQWGHGREAMDGPLGDEVFLSSDELQWGHGREAMDGSLLVRSGLPDRSFNGAMAVRPWMVAHKVHVGTPLNQLQWGHGREAMDGRNVCRPRRPQRQASMGPWP